MLPLEIIVWLFFDFYRYRDIYIVCSLVSGGILVAKSFKGIRVS